MKNSSILLYCFILYIKAINSLQEGEECSIAQTGESGVCTRLYNCSPVLDNIRRKIWNHSVCSHSETVAIVCCPKAQEYTITTTPESISVEARISVKKCNEYKEFAYDKTNHTDVFGVVTKLKRSNCVFNSVPLIFGGTEAKRREFPHMALVGYDNGNETEWNCGGTLISEQFVLTAGHCIDTIYGVAKYVRLGEHNQDVTDDDSVIIDLNIIETITHPTFRSPARYNDIGLLKVQHEVQFSGAIRPACLPVPETVAAQKAIATGWGFFVLEQKSSVLLKVVLEIFSHSECDSSFRRDRNLKNGIVNETQICAGSHDDIRDSCYGDSGGPFQVYHHHHCMYEIVGVTAFGESCGIIGKPGVYTRIQPYLDWIEAIVWPSK